MKVLITTFPFAKLNPLPMNLLRGAGLEIVMNPYGRKMTTAEVAKHSQDVDFIVAGTEILDVSVFNAASKLKLISRVGIGLDGVSLLEAKAKGIRVSYTADAPAPAVSELTLGLMLAGLRSISEANTLMHSGKWKRIFGKRIGDSVVGVIGSGRIGSRVIKHLQGFNPKSILVHDKNPEALKNLSLNVKSVTKEEILKQCDVITLHIPLTYETRNFIAKEEMKLLKKEAFLINTSRGGIINEDDLFTALSEKKIFGAAIDVFEEEPYDGPLNTLENCLLTSHMGSMSEDCRAQMEIEAVEEVLRFVKNEKLLNEVPDFEYLNQKKE